MLTRLCFFLCLSVALGAVFRGLNRPMPSLMQLIVESDNNILLASSHSLYRLNNNLTLLDRANIPLDNSQNGCYSSDSLFVSLTSSSHYHNILFVCSTQGTGICEIRSSLNSSTFIDYDLSTADVSYNLTSTALPSSVTVLNSNGTFLYYVSQPAGVCRQPASVTVFQVMSNSSLTFMEHDELDSSSWSFVGGFSVAEHVYVTARQTSQTGGISTTESVILWFYNQTMRIKGKLKCGDMLTELNSHTIFDQSNKLLASFSDSSRGKSALCVIDIASLQRQFREKYENYSQCVQATDVDENCTWNQTSQNETCVSMKNCSTYLLDFTVNEVELLAFEYDVVITSLEANLSVDGREFIIYAGTKGKLLRIEAARDLSSVLLLDEHTLSPAVNEIIQLQLQQTNLLAVTRREVVSLPIHDCSEATDCMQCTSPRYATFCGWCYASNRCTLRSECMPRDVWVNSTCIEVLGTSPQYIPASNPMPVIVNISGIPEKLMGDLYCDFGNETNGAKAMRIGNNSSYNCTPHKNETLPQHGEETYERNVTILYKDVILGTSLTQLLFVHGCNEIDGKHCVMMCLPYYYEELVTSTASTSPISPEMTTNPSMTATPTVITPTMASSVTTAFITVNQTVGTLRVNVTTPIQNLISTPVTTVQTTTIATTQVVTSTQQATTMAATGARQCLRCVDNCEKCQSNSTCEKCTKDYEITDGTCSLTTATATTNLGIINATDEVIVTNETNSTIMTTSSSGSFPSTMQIIIIAASGGGGLVVLIIIVCICCVVRLRRRGKGAIAVNAGGDFVATNVRSHSQGKSESGENPLTTFSKSKTEATAVQTPSESTAFTDASVGTQMPRSTSGGQRLPPKPPIDHKESDLYIVPVDPAPILPVRSSNSISEPSLQPPASHSARRSFPAPVNSDEVYIAIEDGSGPAPIQEDVYLSMNERPPSPKEALPAADDLYLVVDDKQPVVSHQPVVHSPSDSYVIFTDGRHSGMPETEDLYIEAQEGGTNEASVKPGARLSQTPTPKISATSLPVTKPKAYTLDVARLNELKKELDPAQPQEDEFYENIHTRAMTDVRNINQDQRPGGRTSKLHPSTSGYEGQGGKDIYENLRGRLISDPKSINLPASGFRQVSKPTLEQEEIYGNQDVVDSSNMPAIEDVIYGNSDLVEEQLYANT